MNGEPVRLSKKDVLAPASVAFPGPVRRRPRIFETPMEMISHGQNYR
jgi:hypothetical protein